MRGRTVELRGWALGFRDGRRVRLWVEGREGHPEDAAGGHQRQGPRGSGGPIPAQGSGSGSLQGGAGGPQARRRAEEAALEEAGPGRSDPGHSDPGRPVPGEDAPGRDGGQVPAGRGDTLGSAGMELPGGGTVHEGGRATAEPMEQECGQSGREPRSQGWEPRSGERDGRLPGGGEDFPGNVRLEEGGERDWGEVYAGRRGGIPRAAHPALWDWEEEQQAAKRRQALRLGVEMESWLW